MKLQVVSVSLRCVTGHFGHLSAVVEMISNFGYEISIYRIIVRRIGRGQDTVGELVEFKINDPGIIKASANVR